MSSLPLGRLQQDDLLQQVQGQSSPHWQLSPHPHGLDLQASVQLEPIFDQRGGKTGISINEYHAVTVIDFGLWLLSGLSMSKLN